MSKRCIMYFLVLGGLLSVLLINTAAGQSEFTRGKFSFGGGLGIFQGTGEWTDHRYAPGVKQFSRGFAAEVMVEYGFARWGGIAATFGGGDLGTGEWVDFSRSLGDNITASAQMYHFSLTFRPYLLYRARDILKMDFGVGGFFPSGNESFLFFAYDYTFLYDRFSMVSGIEYCHFVKPNLALAARIEFIYADGAVEYADGLTQNAIGFPMTIGIRFYP
jgi:hypothetical protein